MAKLKSNYILVIPARYKSSRLPGKPLIPLAGKPMIIRTCIQCSKVVKKDKIIVATDDERILKVCQKYGFKAIITNKNCLTGTDRVAEIAKKVKANFYINVQGDEPVFNPKDILKLIKTTTKTNKDVVLGYSEIKNLKDIKNKNKPKIIFDKDKFLIYSSRHPIPFNKNHSGKFYRGIWAYCYPRDKLIIFNKIKKKTSLEAREDIEILRFLEIGIKVKMIKMSDKSISVDVPSDIEKIKVYLKKKTCL